MQGKAADQSMPRPTDIGAASEAIPLYSGAGAMAILTEAQLG
jgi:hypothetical protein